MCLVAVAFLPDFSWLMSFLFIYFLLAALEHAACLLICNKLSRKLLHQGTVTSPCTQLHGLAGKPCSGPSASR